MDKEEKAEYDKIYNIVHKEKRNAVSKAHYLANIDETRARHRKYAQDHKEESHIRGKRWRLANKEKIKTKRQANKKHYSAYILMRKFGLTEEDYKTLSDKQNNKCAICGRNQIELERRLSIDHNHITGRVRGLLCRNCNLLLGHAHDDSLLLQRAAIYVNNYREALP